MSIDDFRDNTRRILDNLLSETPKADRAQLIDAYADLKR